MRTPAKPMRRMQQAQTVSVPAPVGGWNVRDSYADMDATDAVALENWFPMPSEIMVRRGFSEHATGFTGECESLLVYNSPTGTSEMFAVADGEIYDVSSSGAVAAAVVSSLNGNRWQYANISNTGGNYLIAFDGADDGLLYNGTIWANTGITGVTESSIINCNFHKNRLWLIQGSTLDAWYLGVDAVSGAATKFPMGGVFEKGGSLLAMGTWTLVAGQGVDDHAVFITTEGEVAVYKGTDPTSASTWSLVGVWLIGEPCGIRCLQKLGGDLLVICKEGLLPFSKALMSSRVNTKSALSDKIQQAVSEATSLYKTNFGWQILPWPTENMLILNVPKGIGRQEQYVMNTITGSWCNFSGWYASCWATFGEEIYFGSTDYVAKAWDTEADNATNIVADALPAFNYFGKQSQLKRWTMARPVLQSDGTSGILVGLNVDFDTAAPVGVPSFNVTTQATWDVSTWDNGIWGGGLTVRKDWQGASGMGYCAALHIKVATQNADIRWVSTDYVIEPGGVI